MKKYLYLLETLAMFFLCNCFNYIFMPEDMGFRKLPWNPYWVPVLLISARYGFIPGGVSGVIACVNFLFFGFHSFPDKAAIEKLIEGEGLMLPIAFIAAGTVLGAIRQGYKDTETLQVKDLALRKEELDAMKFSVESSEKSKKILEARISRETNTVRVLYDTATRIVSKENIDLYREALNIFSENFNLTRASLYLKEQEYLCLKASYGWDEKEALEGKLLFYKSAISLVFEKDSKVMVRDILASPRANDFMFDYGKILIMFPLKGADGKAFGAIVVEKMDFLELNAPNVQLMELVSEWMGRSINVKMSLDEFRGKEMIDSELDIFKYNFFQIETAREEARVKRYGGSFAAAFIKVEGYGFLAEKGKINVLRMASSLLRKAFSPPDIVSSHKYDGIFAVLSPGGNRADVGAALDNVKNSFNGYIGELFPKGEGPRLIFSLGICDQSNMEAQINKIMMECGIRS